MFLAARLTDDANLHYVLRQRSGRVVTRYAVCGRGTVEAFVPVGQIQHATSFCLDCVRLARPSEPRTREP
jgi:hypothetical protein